MPTNGNNSEDDFMPQTKRPKISPSPKAKRISKATSSNQNKNSPSTLLRYFTSPQRDGTSAQPKREASEAMAREQFWDADIAEAIRRSLDSANKLSNSFAEHTSRFDGLTDEAIECPNNAETERIDIAANHTNNEINDGVTSDFSLVQSEHYYTSLSLSHRSPTSSIADRSSESLEYVKGIVNQVDPSLRQSEPLAESSPANNITCRSGAPDTSSRDANDNPTDDLSTIQMLAEIARSDTMEWGEEDDEISVVMSEEDVENDVLVGGSGKGTTEFDRNVVDADFGYDRVDDIEDTVEKEEAERTELKLPEVGADELLCPICGLSLAGLSLQKSQVHANNCLDSPDIAAGNASTSSPNFTSTSEASDLHRRLHTHTTPSHSTSTTSTTSKATSWSALFDQYKTKVTGIWSAKSTPTLSDSNSGTSGADWSGRGSRPGEENGKVGGGSGGGFWSRNGKKLCPFYKRLPGTTLTMDAFSYGKIPGCSAYFLSHFHSDHYGGLTSNWSHGLIYCSSVTGNLVIQQLRVKPEYIRRLTLNEEHPITDCLSSISPQLHGTSVTVTLIDANHCPGSAIFLFKIPSVDTTGRPRTLRYLHTGDFRACPRQCLHSAMEDKQLDSGSAIDILYLDTTYLNPRYAFPAQEEVVAACCEVVKTIVLKEEGVMLGRDSEDRGAMTGKEKSGLDRWITSGNLDVKENGQTRPNDGNNEMGCTMLSKKRTVKTQLKGNGKVLVVVGTYLIGKEKVFVNLAKILDSKIYVTAAKKRILQCLENPEIEAMLTENPLEAQVHVVPIGSIKVETLSTYLHNLKSHFTHVVAFRPTGWTYRATAAQTLNLSCATLAHITAPIPTFTSNEIRPAYTSPTVSIYGVPYSEHSSFRELAAFVGSLEVRRIIPTVNVGSEKSRQSMETWFRRWEEEKRRNGRVEIVPFRVVDHW